MPRWAAIMRLPKPATVVRPLTSTAKNVLRGSRGPPPCRASRFEVKELATPESFRIDPVGHVPERPRLVAKLLRETVRVRLRASNVVALDRADELIEAREIVRDLLVALDVWPVLREEVASRGDEAEVTERVGERREVAEWIQHAVHAVADAIPDGERRQRGEHEVGSGTKAIDPEGLASIGVALLDVELPPRHVEEANDPDGRVHAEPRELAARPTNTPLQEIVHQALRHPEVVESAIESTLD